MTRFLQQFIELLFRSCGCALVIDACGGNDPETQMTACLWAYKAVLLAS